MATVDLQRLTILGPRDRTREYVSGGYDRTLSPLLSNALQVLDQFQDDLNREFSDVVYDQMMRDPAVAASVDILKALILSEPIRIIPRVQDKKSPEYEASKQVADFVSRQLEEADRPVHSMLLEALEAIQYGSALAEIVYENADDPVEGRPILRFKDLKTRARRNYAFLVDRYYNVLGAVNREWGYSATGIYTGSTSPDPDKVIPRQKFVLLTLGGRYGDPRGSSMLRPAYNAYYVKTQVWPQYLKFLIQFASPSLVGYTPENGPEEIDVLDDNGNQIINSDGTVRTITPEEDMLTTLLGFQAGTVAVLKGGSKLEPIQSTGTGEAFQKAVDLFDRQIAMAILKTHRTLLEAKHGSKADAEASADITDVFVSGLREIVGGIISKDLVYQMVFVNFGPETARRYAPSATLKAMPKQDFSKAADAIAKLWTAKYLHSSQVQESDAMIGLPERDMDDWLGSLQEEDDMRRLDQVERMKLLNPGAGTTDPNTPDPGPNDPKNGQEE